MRLRLFGPLGYDDGETRSAPSASKIRTILATLAISIGGLAGTEDLAEELWAEPPRRVAPTVQTYIFRTRRFLQDSDTADGLIQTTHRGYQLDLDRVAVDILEFDALVEDGVAHLEGDRPDSAIRLLDQALSLSSAPAMADVAAGPKITEKLNWLDHRRETAEHTLWDARLRVSDYGNLIGELSDRRVTRPHDEGVAARLMYALDAVGRPDEASSIYTQLCDRLDLDLGLGPSQRLANMFDSMQSGRLQFDAHVQRLHSSAPGAVVLGAQAKRPAEAIHGRSTEMAELERLVGTGAPLIIGGQRGVGKTAVATALSWSERERFGAGQFIVDVAAARAAATDTVASHVARDLMQRVGVDSAGMATHEYVAAMRSWASTHPAIVVLDGVESVDEVAPLIPHTSASAFLVTAQRRLVGVDNNRVHILAPLPDDAITQIFDAKLGPQWLTDDPDAGGVVVRMCRGLPALGVAVVVYTRKCGCSAADLASRLVDPDTRWQWIETVSPALADLAEDQLTVLGTKLPAIGDDGVFPRVSLDHMELGRSLREFVIEETGSASVVRLSALATYRHLAAS